MLLDFSFPPFPPLQYVTRNDAHVGGRERAWEATESNGHYQGCTKGGKTLTLLSGAPGKRIQRNLAENQHSTQRHLDLKTQKPKITMA